MKQILDKGNKTNKIYTMSSKTYKKKISKEVTKFYRKAPTSYIENINKEAKDITARLGVSEKVQTLYGNQVFLTTKDHKENFL